MTHDSKRAVVVTGASTGIGEACVAALVESGFFVFGSVRKAQDGARLQSRFGASYAPLIFDVTDAAAIGRAAQEVETSSRARRSRALSTTPESPFPVRCCISPSRTSDGRSRSISLVSCR